ncbi:FUSC family protein, partial [Microbacterium sp.]|uniref:FUSC family protein n=1 Tax=Microbacterium sp. TaxID=51671 RepID=UPI0037C61EB4
SGAQLNARVIRGIQRLVGTLLGVLVAAGILSLDMPPLAVIAVGVLVGTIVAVASAALRRRGRRRP